MTAWVTAHWLIFCLAVIVLGMVWLLVLVLRELWPTRRPVGTGDSPSVDTRWGDASMLTQHAEPDPDEIRQVEAHAPTPLVRPVRVPQCPACGFFDVAITPKTQDMVVVACAVCGATTPWTVHGPWPATTGPMMSRPRS